MISLRSAISNIRVSSTLNRDSKNHGKQFLMDGNEETCWNSDSGQTQFISVQFNSSQTIHMIEIMFQGGFSSSKIELIDDDNGNLLESFYPEDSNVSQKFDCNITVTNLKIVFSKCADFYGRIVIYNLDFYKK